MITTSQFLETLAATWSEATPAEREELVELVLETVFVDVSAGRLTCVQPKAPYVALFRQVSGLKEYEGCFYVARCENTEWGC